MNIPISIVIPFYNQLKYLKKALVSVENQTHSNWEIILIDDASPEKPERLLKEVPVTLKNKIKLISHEKNKGVSAARNSGIMHAKFSFVAFLDSDDFWEPRHLELSIKQNKKARAFDVITGPIKYYEEKNNKRYGWQFPSWIINQFPFSLAANCFIQPSATLVRTDLLQQAGGFDTSKELEHIEDYDLWIRLVEMGAKFAFRDEITCVYRRHSGAASMDPGRMARLHQNLVQKHSLFFLSSQRVLLQSLMHRSGNMDLLMRSPLFQAYASLFQVFRKIKRKLFAKPPA